MNQAHLDRPKNYNRRNHNGISPTALLMGGVAAGTFLLALGVSNQNNERTPEGPAKNIDTAVTSHDMKKMSEYGIQQLEGEVVVKIGANVRTSPTASDNEGFENTSPHFTDLAESEEDILLLDNPYVVDDPSNVENGVWYGAEDPDSHEVYWVNQAAVAKITGEVTSPSNKRTSYIYSMSESR